MRSALDGMEAPDQPTAHVLNGAQQQALAQIEAAIDSEAFQTFLLHGITGSGKTEVYIAALRRVIVEEKNRHHPRPRDRPHPADGPPLPGTVRGSDRRTPLAHEPRRAV